MALEPRFPRRARRRPDSLYAPDSTPIRYNDRMRQDALMNPRTLVPVLLPAISNQGTITEENGPEIPGGGYVSPAGYVAPNYVENTP